jgi:hypothetical protein
MYAEVTRHLSDAVCALENQVVEEHNQVVDLVEENQNLKSEIRFHVKERDRLVQKLVEAGLV